MILISDYGKGVCTPSLLHAVIDRGRASVKVLADPIRSSDYGRYHGVHCMTPNRLEAQLATGMTIDTPEDALRVGRKLVETLEMEAVLVTLDRDGMALVRADGRAELLPTRPRQVYDITGAGDMVLSVVGLCIACGSRLRRSRRAGQHRRRASRSRSSASPCWIATEILRDLIDHHHPEETKILNRKRSGRRGASPPSGGPDGCLHQRLLRPAASRPRAAAARGGQSGRFPRRRPELRRQRPPLERAEPPDQPGRGPRPRS